MDVAQFYPSISPKRLIWALARKIKDKRFLKIVYDIMVSCGGGLAIGYYINQWLANYAGYYNRTHMPKSVKAFTY